MALGTHRVSALAAPGMTAAATARSASGGRNVASVSRNPLEEAGFSAQVSVNDNALLRYEDEVGFDAAHDQGDPQRGNTPYMFRMSSGFQVDEAEEALDKRAGGEEPVFRSLLTSGIGTYEQTMRITTPGTVKPGSVLNYLY